MVTTRVALIADIHGNATALDAVLEEMEQEGLNEVVCLGDVAATGPEPVAALERVRALDCPVVLGNTDEWLLDPAIEDGTDEANRNIQDIDTWCANKLSDSLKRFITSFEDTIVPETGAGVRIRCYHGSPKSHSHAIEATTPEARLDGYFDHSVATIFAGAHTHVQLFRRYRDAVILNPGSVGLPHERTDTGIRNPARAEWAVVSIEQDSFDITFRRTALDLEEVTAAALDSDMPHAEWWCEGWEAV